ncbi:hypothetical protein OM992_02270 [Bacillus siamensis]|nr:hypothetical protein [Bacillus siamensis]UZD74567.1 hypothetical protein OM992_02270 [Bacillus siamensis]
MKRLTQMSRRFREKSLTAKQMDRALENCLDEDVRSIIEKKICLQEK